MKALVRIGLLGIGLLAAACAGDGTEGSSDGGTRQLPPPAHARGGTPYPDVTFDNPGVSPFVESDDDALSTFALDVDTGSYTITRRFVGDGVRPDPDSVRVEEFVNYFDQGYPTPDRETFAIYIDGAPTPYMQFETNRVIRVGVQAMDIDDEDRKPAALTFVVDTSGSMGTGNRLGLVRESLAMLVEELYLEDRVAIIEYGSEARIVLEPTYVRDRRDILRAIDSLDASGSTNAEQGLRLGYRVAANTFIEGANNRVILASDGVANVGVTDSGGILERIRDDADVGIQLVTVGFGMGNYNDELMEQLADDGDGFYAYVDTLDEAERLFVDDLTGTLQTVARDARIQVEFDPQVVSYWRLIGFENRALEDDEFRDDRTDAGEIGAGHSVTALYEVELTPEAARDPYATLGRASLRWIDVDDSEARELARTISTDDLARSFESASPRLQLAVLVAQYAEVLRESRWAGRADVTLADVAYDVRLLDELGHDDDDVREFVRLVERTLDPEDRGRRDGRDPDRYR
jgi:Ca-activated chloride channel family protein